MGTMIFDKDRKTIRALAREYGMSPADARQMLAIERGTITSDVKEVETIPPSNSPIRRHGPFFTILANVLGMFSGLLAYVRSHR